MLRHHVNALTVHFVALFVAVNTYDADADAGATAT